MDFVDFSVGKNDEDRRLDKVIRLFLKDAPLSQIYKLLRKGLIRVNQKKSDPDYRIQQNDVISIAEFLLENQEKSEHQIKKVELPQIIFQNEHLLILNKPYDIAVHGKESLAEQVQAFYESKNQQNNSSLSFKTGPLHRLDKKTTGLIAFSWSLEGARWFSENIKNHTIKKTYKTILQGHLQKEEIWEDFIEETHDNLSSFHTVKASSTSSQNAKNAYSIFTPISYGKYKGMDVTFAQVQIKTGRMHQIRAQSALHNFPLLGDIAYNAKKINETCDLFLHAAKLEFPQENPLNLPQELSAPLPIEFLEFLTKSCDITKFEV